MYLRFIYSDKKGECTLDNGFKPIIGVGNLNFNDMIKTNNLMNDNIQRIYNESTRNTQEIAKSISKQKQEENRRKELDSRNLEITAQNANEIKELLSSMNHTLDVIVNKIGQEAELNQAQLREMNKLLFEIKDIALAEGEESNEEKESKMLSIIKTGLSVGGQASMMLVFEYLKFKAKQYGLPMN